MLAYLLSPLIAFPLYLLLVGLLSGLGRLLAERRHPTLLKMGLYASGEASPRNLAMPGYRDFFRIALFFAILHLGVLMLASGGLSLMSGIYLLGLGLALLALLVE